MTDDRRPQPVDADESKIELSEIQTRHAVLRAAESLHEIDAALEETRQFLRLCPDDERSVIERIETVRDETQRAHDEADDDWTQRHLRKAMESLEKAQKYAESEKDEQNAN